jgi:2-methylaconitate cis-trans-isomerase PrpF
MALKAIPALFMRGGTSKALVFDIRNLPARRDDWSAIILGAMGSPDPYQRQLDGMGGAVSSLSKVCIVGPPTRPDADIDFTFGQVAIDEPVVDYAGNCGNMISAMGPAALEFGYLAAPADGETSIRIHNTNTGKIIVSRFPVRDGRLDPDGALAIDGVAGTAAPIRLEFLAPGGAKTGRLLPSGAAVDVLGLADGRTIAASLVDAANPCVFVAASDLGKTGAEHPDELAADAGFLESMEAIRRAGSVRMGLSPDLAAAGRLASIPKVAIVAGPRPVRTIAGADVADDAMSLVVRMLSMGQVHKAVPITGAICLAVARRIPGSLPQMLSAPADGPLTLSHPSGAVLVDAEIQVTDAGIAAVHGTVYRTARKLFSGLAHYR